MFRVFRDREKTLEFLTYNEFSNWRIKMAGQGFKPVYSHTIRLQSGVYIYYYQLRTMGEASNAKPVYS